MLERFDTVINEDDHKLTREELIAGMRESDVIVPCVTDRIDELMIAEAGGRLGMIANLVRGSNTWISSPAPMPASRFQIHPAPSLTTPRILQWR